MWPSIRPPVSGGEKERNPEASTMAGDILQHPNGSSQSNISSTSVMVPSGSSSSSGLPVETNMHQDITDSAFDLETQQHQKKTVFEKEFQTRTEATYSSMTPRFKTSFKQQPKEISHPMENCGHSDFLNKILGTSGRDTFLIGRLFISWCLRVLFMSSLPISYQESRSRVICMFNGDDMGDD